MKISTCKTAREFCVTKTIDSLVTGTRAEWYSHLKHSPIQLLNLMFMYLYIREMDIKNIGNIPYQVINHALISIIDNNFLSIRPSSTMFVSK